MSTTSPPSSTSQPQYTLYYWPDLPGRGEFARLLFADTNTSYDEPFSHIPSPSLGSSLAELKQAHPFFALPCLSITTSPSSPPLFISTTAVQCRYLAFHLDHGRLAPTTEADDYRAQELAAICVDAVGEGHDAWHAIDKQGSYASQKDATQPHIKHFVSTRLPKWLDLFESALIANGGEVLVGKALTYGTHVHTIVLRLTYPLWRLLTRCVCCVLCGVCAVDLFVFHWLHGVQYQCPAEFASLPIPLLRAFKARIEARPGIAERLRTRTVKYDGTGPIF